MIGNWLLLWIVTTKYQMYEAEILYWDGCVLILYIMSFYRNIQQFEHNAGCKLGEKNVHARS